eukprot:764570-Hanusia_phi.AAC.1
MDNEVAYTLQVIQHTLQTQKIEGGKLSMNSFPIKREEPYVTILPRRRKGSPPPCSDPMKQPVFLRSKDILALFHLQQGSAADKLVSQASSGRSRRAADDAGDAGHLADGAQDGVQEAGATALALLQDQPRRGGEKQGRGEE